MSEGFDEQYDRVRRWYNRFETLSRGRVHDVFSENYLDEIYAFFMNCNHLKDWIVADPAVPKTVRQSAKLYVEQTPVLKLCADICNSLKHLAPSRSPHSGENPQFGSKHFSVSLGGGPTTIKLKYEINTNTGPMDAFQLATECMNAWERFLSTQGLK